MLPRINKMNVPATAVSHSSANLDVAQPAMAAKELPGSKIKGRATSAPSGLVHRFCLSGLSKFAYCTERAAVRPIVNSAAKFRKVKVGNFSHGMLALTKVAVRAHSHLATEEEKLAFANRLKYPGQPKYDLDSAYSHALQRRQRVPPPKYK